MSILCTDPQCVSLEIFGTDTQNFMRIITSKIDVEKMKNISHLNTVQYNCCDWIAIPILDVSELNLLLTGQDTQHNLVLSISQKYSFKNKLLDFAQGGRVFQLLQNT